MIRNERVSKCKVSTSYIICEIRKLEIKPRLFYLLRLILWNINQFFELSVKFFFQSIFLIQSNFNSINVNYYKNSL